MLLLTFRTVLFQISLLWPLPQLQAYACEIRQGAGIDFRLPRNRTFPALLANGMALVLMTEYEQSARGGRGGTSVLEANSSLGDLYNNSGLSLGNVNIFHRPVRSTAHYPHAQTLALRVCFIQNIVIRCLCVLSIGREIVVCYPMKQNNPEKSLAHRQLRLSARRNDALPEREEGESQGFQTKATNRAWCQGVQHRPGHKHK